MQLDFAVLVFLGLASVPLLILHHTVWPDYPDICMSQTPTPDNDVVELALDFAGLSITVRGSSDSATSFVRGLASGSPSAASSINPPSTSGYSAVTPAASSATPALSLPVTETRSSIEESFPPVPANWLRAARNLTGGGVSGEERVSRAWRAGCWARAVLDNRIGSPNRSSACRLQNRYWVVVYCRGLETPKVYTSSRAFFNAVGRIEGSDTLCHGFASATEAETYLEAAGFPFPLSLN